MVEISKEKELLCKHMSQVLPSLRASLRLSQTELGDYAGISRQTISEIERGEYHMSWNQFASLYLVFGSNRESHEVLEENDLGIQNIAPVIVVSNSINYEAENNQNLY